MSAKNSLDGPSESSSSVLPSRAITSLAKKQTDITRQGAQKLKFVPTLPVRRKKEEVNEASPTPARSYNAAERGRGRGRGEGSGRGRGRGAPRPESEMTASGPFAMGPALAGNNARRSVPRSNFAPIMSPSKLGSSLAAPLPHTSVPSLKRETDLKANGKDKEMVQTLGDEEVYSDPDDGVEIVDMENVRQMDWMAPESLQKERHVRKIKIKHSPEGAVTVDIDRGNALDLSDSEEEEELEDIMEHFAANADVETDPTRREERLYFFQFPSPFPDFIQNPTSPSPTNNSALPEDTTRKVSSTEDVKPGLTKGVDSSKEPDNERPKIDGIIGRLEIYQSGAVRMRLANGILLDVNAATQPSFLQQAVYLDEKEKKLIVLGEVNKRFSVSPNVETLLATMEAADRELSTASDGEI